MSLSEIEALNSHEREEFARCAALLTAKTFILRETPENKLSREFSFIQRKRSLFEEYLALSCWSLYYDSQLGIIYVKNTEGYNKATFNKLTTQILITLRLIFEERRMSGSTMNVVFVEVSELLAKMINELSVLSKKPMQKDIKDSLRTLERYNIIYKCSGAYDDMECRLKVLKSILIAVPDDRCKAVYETFRTENDNMTEDDDEASDEVATD